MAEYSASLEAQKERAEKLLYALESAPVKKRLAITLVTKHALVCTDTAGTVRRTACNAITPDNTKPVRLLQTADRKKPDGAKAIYPHQWLTPHPDTGDSIVIASYPGCTLPGMRMKLTEHGGAQWLNDAYNANPDSMKATLQWLSEFADPSKLLLVLGDMREVGALSEPVHEEILHLALERFPGARIAAVGPFMTLAANRISSAEIKTFPDSVSAAEPVRAMVHPGDIVFLKASRGTRLERIEPEQN